MCGANGLDERSGWVDIALCDDAYDDAARARSADRIDPILDGQVRAQVADRDPRAAGGGCKGQCSQLVTRSRRKPDEHHVATARKARCEECRSQSTLDRTGRGMFCG